MDDAPKVAEEPKVEPKSSDDKLIDNRRQQIEELVLKENSSTPTDKVEEESTPEPKPDEKPKADEDEPVAKIKKSVQKRIDKVVAQKKTLEEELAETKAELERLKNKPQDQPKVETPDGEPTVEQVEAYIVKMREEGNVREEVAATRYLIKMEKEAALKEVKEAQEKASNEEKQKKERNLKDWTDLCKDYSVYDDEGKPDIKAEMNLSNQNGLLYKTALSLFNDKELHADYYNDPNPIYGFRRAVADAYREIYQQNLLKTNPKGETIEVPRNPREVLAEPSAEGAEDFQSQSQQTLSDAEKVREEIRSRKKNRFLRSIPPR